MAGRNLAKSVIFDSAVAMESYASSKKKPCIFLSHISVDKDIVREIGNYLKEEGGLNIYLDENDENLQTAVRDKDPHAITKFIENGLSISSHLMCLVSHKTSESWWVPYEVGFAKKSGVKIAALKIKDSTYLPEFLEISDILKGTKSLNKYIQEIQESIEYSSLIYDSLPLHSQDPHPLDEYLYWDQ